MHLCVVSPFPPELTGVGQYGWNVVHGLARAGRLSAITVLAQRAPRGHASAEFASAAAGGITTRRVWARDDVVAAARLARHIRAARPDVVWFNAGFTIFGESRPANFLGLMAPLLARRAGLPLVVTLHELPESTLPKSIGAKNGRLTALGLRAATHLLLQSEAVAVTLRRYQALLQARYGARNVRHIPHGALAPVARLPRPPAAPPEDVLFFGSLAPFKGVPVLLEALARLQRRRPQATLTVAGSDHPRFVGYHAALAAAHASRNGAGPHGVRWLGAQPEHNLRALFAQARVVALPYTATTGASSVLYRAAASGRPVVASDLPDLRAAAEEGGLCVDFVPPGDPGALAAALECMLASPARQAAQVEANLAAMQAVTLERTCAHYLDVFAQVAA